MHKMICANERDKIRIESRVLEVTQYIIDTKSTVRAAAKVFGVSKTTVHKDVTERILEINPFLAKEVEKVLLYNKSQGSSRGGKAVIKKFGKVGRTSL
ncbi:sporulation transcriptional regulator SpoIIID [Clostridium baratii]|uniref:sporulation transcriptional regulator SpoIIID n=1 Tax=Clostridium baratii TaxID=1561 RepID=UPI0030D24A35